MDAKEEIVKRILVVFVLWGTSYTLQDIAVIVSIIAGTIGIIYTLSMLVILWLNYFKQNRPQNRYWNSGDIDG